MRTLAIHSNHVRCLAYSPDGSHIATASNDRSVRLLDAATGKTVRSWTGLGGVMQAVAFSPDGTRIAFGGQIGAVRVACCHEDGESEALPLRLPGMARVTSLAYTPDGRSILCGTGDRSLRVPGHLYVLDPTPLGVRLSLEARLGVQHVAVRSDGKQVALGTGEGHRLGWTADWAVLPSVWRAGSTSPAVAYSPDGAILAVAYGFAINLYRVVGDQYDGMLRGHKGKVTSLAFTPDGRKLISGSWDRTARIWDVASWREEAALAWERGKVQYVAVAPDGMTAAAACDKGVVIWDLDG